MKYIVRVVSEETFHGVVTGYIGPFDSRYDADNYAEDIAAHHNGEAEAYVEELHPPTEEN